MFLLSCRSGIAPAASLEALPPAPSLACLPRRAREGEAGLVIEMRRRTTPSDRRGGEDLEQLDPRRSGDEGSQLLDGRGVHLPALTEFAEFAESVEAVDRAERRAIIARHRPRQLATRA